MPNKHQLKQIMGLNRQIETYNRFDTKLIPIITTASIKNLRKTLTFLLLHFLNQLNKLV